MEDIIIIGAGGFGREVWWLIEEINAYSPRWAVRGFVDDSPSLKGKHVCGVPVLGTLDVLMDKPGHAVALGVGIPGVKKTILEKLKPAGLSWPTLVSPDARMSKFVSLGAGTLITSGCILTTQVEVGAHVLLNLACTVGHDTRIMTGATLSPGVSLSGYSTVGPWSDIGTRAVTIPGITIGRAATVGAGAVVIRDVPAGATAVGNPARVIRQPEPVE
ncbi:NeuD/PglB/VioB family sugar acetyltransferase [Lujinxingia sediminis]|nr:NeuD/PglB/VioB family sugar acetyltransferase [Lujinxingia sediminis]